MLIISLLALVVSAIRGKPSELPSADTSGSSSAALASVTPPSSTETAAPTASALPVVASAAPQEPKTPKPAGGLAR